MDNTAALLESAFEEQEEFDGVMIVNDATTAEAHCNATVNPIEAQGLSAVIRSPVSSFQLMGAQELPNIVVRSDPDLRSPYVQVEGYLRGSKSKSGHEVSHLDVKVQETLRFNEHRIEEDSGKKDKRYVSWFFPIYERLGDPFFAHKHKQRGLLYGWKFNDPTDIGNGEWVDQEYSFESGGRKYTLQPEIHFESISTAHGEGHIAFPQMRLMVMQKGSDIPSDEREAVSLIRDTEDLVSPFQLALSFAAARKVRSHYQTLDTLDYENGSKAEVERFVSVKTGEPSGLVRSLSFTDNWKLIKNVTKAIEKQSESDRKRIKKAISRYAEAYDASFIEMSLVALHSGLTIIVDEWSGRDIDPDPNLPDIDGRLLTPLRKFITENDIPWKDLIPEGEPYETLFDFNDIRNQYLKDIEIEMEEATPLRIAQQLFERCLLAYVGLEPDCYDALERP